MATIYTENPHDFVDITSFVLIDKEQIINYILLSDKVYFYDTCSFRKHACLQTSESIFEYIKKHNGIVVVTRCILMELASHSGVLDTGYVNYFRKMSEAGLNVLLLSEEDVFDVLSVCFSTNAKMNELLSWAVKNVKRPTSTIEATLKVDANLMKEVINGQSTDGTLFNRFFASVRSNKESSDNLGEEMITICAHLLSNIPSAQEFRYVVLTDDKGAIGIINKASKNIYEYVGQYEITALTTARLTQCLFDEHIITEVCQVEELLLMVSWDDVINVFGSEEYDLDMREKHMTYSELARKIVTPNTIHINY